LTSLRNSITVINDLSASLGLPPEGIYEIGRQCRMDLAKRYAERGDVLNWGKMLFPEKFPLPFCSKLHQYLVDIRYEEFTDTEAPRNHSKTTIKCFLVPIFQALVEPWRFRHYLNVQATGEKASAVNMAIRTEIERNEELRELYGDQVGGFRWNESQFVLSNGTIFTSVGAGQSIRGLNYHNIRPDYILVDDLYNEEDINNVESTSRKNAWFWGSLYPARAKSRITSIHVQGTAINNEDLLEKLKTQPRWKAKTFRAIEDWDKKVVLWPELNTFESLEADREDMGTIIFFREMQNERRDEASAIIKESWLNDWEYDPAAFDLDVDWQVLGVVVGVDPSIGEKETSDYSGMARTFHIKHRITKEELYLIDGLLNEHLSLERRVEATEKISTEHVGRYPTMNVTSVRIEGISGFKDFAQTVANRTSLPVNIIDQVRDKISTLENKSHFFENKKVRLNKNIHPKLKETLRYQLITNYPKHDDMRDGVLLTLDEKDSNWKAYE
jgi:hypothetical protein